MNIDGILILDADTGYILDANPFLLKMLRYSHADFLGKKLWEIGPFSDIASSMLRFSELQEKGYVRYEHLPLQTKDSRLIDVEFVSNVYHVDNKKIIQCNIRDITLRKRAEEELQKGLEPLLEGTEPTMKIELILSTFPDLVESELGSSIHEERIIAQRDTKVYKGYVPMNVEFLLEYLFAVGFSPETTIDHLPIKLWGRYLPETLIHYVRRLYNLPQQDLFC